MAEEKKTQLGQTPGRTHRPTGSPPIASAVGTMQPSGASGTPAPMATSGTAVTDPGGDNKAKSYLPATVDPLIDSNVADRYKILKKLGEGGMGAVYLALHTVLEKQVALKVLHGEFARKPDLVERFMQEAKAASRIRHENVIDISDFGATPDGLVFFAMELLRGHDLHEEITRAKLAGNLLPWSRTKKIFLQVCSALTAAHGRGIIHRDLKPENIFLVEFLGDGDFVKLLDFGIAKLTDTGNPGEEGGRKLTKTGMLFGTPEYMSPEQARGDKVDHRVDIYAMGCILFQLITNQVPFQAENFMGVLSQHLTADPPQISPVVLDQIGAPRAIADIIDKALTKDPNTRWQTIDEMASAIREACGDAPAADRSTKLRAASVPNPGDTTRQRPVTGLQTPVPATPSVNRARTPTGPVKDQWTGTLVVPEAVEEAPRAASTKSKLPLIIGGIVLVAAAAGAAVMVLGKGGGTPAPVVDGSGSADTQPAAGSGSAVVVTPDPPKTVEPVIPDQVSLTFTSTPKGAKVIDGTDPSIVWGVTPVTFSVPGSTTARRFKFVLKNHGDAIVELVPNRPAIEFAQTLVRGATKAGAAVTQIPDPVTKPDTKPDPVPAAGSDVPVYVKQPDPDPPIETKPDVKPDPKPDPKPDTGVQQLGGSGEKKPDCLEEPCLKDYPGSAP